MNVDPNIYIPTAQRRARRVPPCVGHATQQEDFTMERGPIFTRKDMAVMVALAALGILLSVSAAFA